MNNEIKSILNMVASGKITADEGEQLIDSLNKNQEKVETILQKPIGKKFLHIEVLSTEDDDDAKVKVNIPLALAKTVLKMGNIQNQITMNAPDIELNLDQIIEMIEDHTMGELVNIESGNSKVRIWID